MNAAVGKAGGQQSVSGTQNWKFRRWKEKSGSWAGKHIIGITSDLSEGVACAVTLQLCWPCDEINFRQVPF